MLIRRGHLYLGLLLCPWVFLYGVTAYLFNHPSHFSDSNLRHFDSGVVARAGFDGVPTAGPLAAQVVQALNERFPEVSLSLIDAHPSRFDGDLFFAGAESDSKQVQLLVFRNGNGGTIREQVRNKSEAKQADFVIAPKSSASGNSSTEQFDPKTEPLKIDSGIDRTIATALPKMVRELGYPELAENVKLTSVPVLEFAASASNGKWLVRYDCLKGTVSAKELDEALRAKVPGWRRYLLGMHTAHGYPGEKSPRWYWAIVVDVMAALMVFWGASGIVMWWQIKRLRLWGSLTIAVSLMLAAWLFAGMATLPR